MKKILALFLAALLLATACAPSDTPQETTETAVTETTAPDPYALIHNSTEKWLHIGHKAYLAGTTPDFDAAAFFLEGYDNIAILALYNDYYLSYPAAFEPIAILFYRYVHDTYGYDALFDLDKRAQYKSAWLKTLDPSLLYPNDPASEPILSQMTSDYDNDYSFINTVEGATYCFESYEDISASLAHQFMLYNTYGLRALREKIAAIDPDGVYFDANKPLTYIAYTTGNPPSFMTADGRLHVLQYEDFLALGARAMFVGGNPDADWIAEGLAELYGKAYDYFYLATYDRAFYLYPDYLETYFKPMAAEGNARAAYFLAVSMYYYGSGADLIQKDDGSFSVDGPLYAHAAAKAELTTEYFTPLSAITSARTPGSELSRAQAASFCLWLMETDRASETELLACTVDAKAYEALGDYETLKADWLTWLDTMEE